MVRLLILLSISFLTVPAGAEAPLNLTVHAIPYFIESEERGTFVDLTREIAERLGIQIIIEIYPSIRAIDNFRKNKSLIYLPGNEPKLKGYDFYKSDPIFMKSVFIYSMAPTIYSNIGGLEGKRIGITMGYTYPPELARAENAEIQEGPNDEANLRKLQAGRIDAFLGEEHSANQAMSTLGFKNILYNKNKPLATEPIFYAFQKTPEGQKWRNKFNDLIKMMKKSGQLDKIVLRK